MMKHTDYPFAYVTLLLWPVLLFSMPGKGNLANYGRNAKEFSFHLKTAYIRADTIPVEERESFDRPFGAVDYTPHNPNPFSGQEEEPSKIIPEVPVEVDTSFSQVQKIPEEYSGFKIEIMTAGEPLPSSHDIFFQHGNLAVDRLRNGTYSYVLGDFQSLDEANAFLLDFLIGRYPEAKVVEYESGGRL